MKKKRNEEEAFPQLAKNKKTKGYQLLLYVDEVQAFDYDNVDNAKYNINDIKSMITNCIITL